MRPIFASKEGSQQRVEFAIKLPSKDSQIMYFPIDAKFPLTVYEKLQQAIEDDDKLKIEAGRKELTKTLKKWS